MAPEPERSLIVKFAETPDEVRAAQALRYRVFVDEMGASVPAEAAAQKLDIDDFDPLCDHVIVIDTEREANEGVIGTYRLMRRSRRDPDLGFYTETEYDVSCTDKIEGEIAEVGRSCIEENYRNKAVMQMLWTGIANYVAEYEIRAMFGCASFHGTDAAEHALCLSWLYHNHLAPEEFRPIAIAEHTTPMDLMPPDQVDDREVLKLLPPLIKGYLRVGATVGDGAVIDHEFNTIDVCVFFLTELAPARYVRHFMGEDQVV